MASSVLRLSLLSTLFLTAFGCNPSQNPSNGDTTVYQKVKFSMNDVKVDGRWTSPAVDKQDKRVPPQKTIGSAVYGIVIRPDLENIVDGVTAIMGLPQDMVSVSVDQNSEKNSVSNIELNSAITEDGDCMATDTYFFIEKNTGLVRQCNTTAKAGKDALFTITGQFASTVATTKDNWQKLADAVQTKLGSDNFGFVEFDNDDKITITTVA